jgi:hypothetical protein
MRLIGERLLHNPSRACSILNGTSSASRRADHPQRHREQAASDHLGNQRRNGHDAYLFLYGGMADRPRGAVHAGAR